MTSSSARFSAPGKLVLCGEYAVVDGRPAVVTAVDRRASVTVTAASDLRVRGNDPRWLIVRPSHLLEESADDDNSGAREQPLLLAVLREVKRRGSPLAPAHIAVSTTSFSADAGKLGLGSSAAAAVAFASVFVHGQGLDVVHDVARAAHRFFQGGGSGIDVAASVYGGLLVFQDGRITPAPALPKELSVVVAYSGVPAHTQGFVDAYKALPDRAAHADAMTAATERFLRGSRAGDADDVIRAVDDARSAMDNIGRAAKKDVVTREHKAIAALAHAAGGAAKPSGAGGGDVAVCFVPASRRVDLETALASAGFAVVKLAIGAPGVRIDP